MITRFHKKFLKDLSGLPLPYRKRVEVLVFETFVSASSVTQIPGVEKLKGYNNYYKIRIGDYRVGFSMAGTEVVFERVLHRKEIYRHFPID